MADSTVTIGADLSALRRELGQIPNLTDANAQKMLAKLERAVRSAEKAAKASTKASTKAMLSTQKAAQGAEKAIADAGGELARFGGMLSVPGLEGAAPAFTALGDSLELLATPGGAAIAVFGSMAASVGLAIAAIKGMDEATEALRDLGYESRASGHDLVAVGEAAAALDAVNAAGLQLSQTFAVGTAPGVEALATSTAKLLGSLDPMIGTLGHWTSNLSIGVTTLIAFAQEMKEAGDRVPWYASMLSFGTAPLFEMAGALDNVIPRAVANAKATDEMGDAAGRAALTSGELAKALDDQRQMLQALGVIGSDAEDLAREAAAREAAAKAATAYARAQNEVASALSEIQAITDGHAEKKEGIELLFEEIDALDKQAAAYADNAEVLAKVDEAKRAVAAANEAQAREIHQNEIRRAKERAVLLVAEETAQVDFIEASKRMAAELSQMSEQAMTANRLMVGESIDAMLMATSDLANSLAFSGKLTEKAAMQAYKVAKVTGMAQVAISTAIAIAKAMELGPFFAPLGIAAAVSTGAAQAVAIQTTPPPSFFAGGGPMAASHPDATTAVLHRGERVQPAASVRRDDRGDMRASMSGASEPAPVQIQIMYGGRALDTVVSSEAQRPGSALRKATGTPRLGQRTR